MPHVPTTRESLGVILQADVSSPLHCVGIFAVLIKAHRLCSIVLQQRLAQDYFLVLLPHSPAQAFCSYWSRHYFGYKFAFPACSSSAKTTICGLAECLIHQHDIPHNMLLIKELTSQQKTCSNGPLLIEFSGHTMCPSS